MDSFLLRKSMDWFLYDNGVRHKRVKIFSTRFLSEWDLKGAKQTYFFDFYRYVESKSRLENIFSLTSDLFPSK